MTNPLRPGGRPIPHLSTVATAPGAVLLATWDDGRTDRVELVGWIESGHPYFHRLRDAAVFATATVTDEGSVVTWDDDDDLAIDSVNLALLAEQQRDFGRDDLVAWQERRGISNQEAADLVGVHVNTWSNYRAGTTTVPRGVAIAIRAMDRDPLLFAAHYRPRRNGRPPAAAE